MGLVDRCNKPDLDRLVDVSLRRQKSQLLKEEYDDVTLGDKRFRRVWHRSQKIVSIVMSNGRNTIGRSAEAGNLLATGMMPTNSPINTSVDADTSRRGDGTIPLNYQQTLTDGLLQSNLAKIRNDKEDIYSKLMDKEKGTLEIIDRVVNYEQNKSQAKLTFFEMSLSDICVDYVVSLSAMLDALVKADSAVEFVAYVRSDNKYVLYAGVTFVLVAVVVMLIECAS